MKNIPLLLLLALLMGACKAEKKSQTSAATAATDSVVEVAKPLPPLVAEDVFLKDKDPFGEVIELKGENIVPDSTIFRISGCHAFIKGNRMVMRNRTPEYTFMIWNYPELTLRKYAGKWGNGPGEFSSATLIATPDTSLLCYAYNANTDMYKMDREGNLHPYPSVFSHLRESKRNSFLESIVNVSPDNFYYIGTTGKGKAVMQARRVNDSTEIKEICNLAFDPKFKSPFRYIGDFAIDPSGKRMVYAYKYFKLIKFMDIDGKNVRTLNFQQKGFDEGSLQIVNGLDQNVTHYWGICPQKDHVYCIYSGRTPMEVGREAARKNYYMYIEQYDWAGNPVRKYKVDRWGYFTVDEANRKLYVFSNNDDDPFFVFQLPEI